MRILLVHNYYRFRGGEAVYFESLTKLLKSRGHKVHIWTKDNTQIGDSVSKKVKIASGMFWNREVEKDLSSVIQKFKPDIAHFNNIFPLITPTAYYVCNKLGVPVVQTVHNFRYLFPKSLLLRRGEICELCLDKRFVYPVFLHGCYSESLPYTLINSTSRILHQVFGSFEKADAFIFPSKFAKNYYLKNAGIDSKKAHMIPNFVDIKRKESTSKKENYFLYVGSLAEHKGIIGLLNAFATLENEKLVVIGDGPLRKEIDKYKKYKNIEIKGPLPKNEVYQYMEKAQFIIIPSRCYEIMPTVLVESFAQGTAVIAPNQGVFKELIKDGEAGLLYNYKDPKALRSTVAKTAKDKKLTEKMSTLALKEYRKNYSKASYYKKLLAVYKSSIAK